MMAGVRSTREDRDHERVEPLVGANLRLVGVPTPLNPQFTQAHKRLEMECVQAMVVRATTRDRRHI